VQVGVASLEPLMPLLQPSSSVLSLSAATPVLVAHPAVIAFLQGCLLTLGTGASLYLLSALSSTTSSSRSSSRAAARCRLRAHSMVLLAASVPLWFAVLN